MAKVLLGMMMSLDGYINDRHGSVAPLYPDFAALRSSASLQEAMRATGAVVMGRRSYEMGNGDFTGYEFQVPIFVLTHQAPAQVAKGENEHLRFNFVTDGPVSAIRQAKLAAGERNVMVVGGASTIQQLLNARLADELHLDVRPIILGAGLRLFEHLDAERIALEPIGAAYSPALTELRFHIVR